MAKSTAGEVVSVNVGGQMFTTYKSTLCQYPDSTLTVMLSGVHPMQYHNGSLFLDRDGDLFEHVLDFLRSGPEFELPADARTQRRLLREFRYLGLPTTIFRDLSPSLARVYAVGGCMDTHMHRPVSTVLCYDTNFEGWCDVAELPTARACVAAATLAGKLYVLGGKDSWGKEMTGVYTCDLATHTIATDEVRSMATPRHTFGAATAAGRIYVVGHGRLGDEQETVEFYDPGSMAWWSTTPLPQAPRNHAVVSWPGPCGEAGAGSGPTGDHSQVVFSSGGYVTMPGIGLTCSSELMMLDVRTKAWKAVTPMPIARARHGMAACNGRLFLIGGSTTGMAGFVSAAAAAERPTAAVHCYDVRAGRWVETDPAPLPRPLESLAAVAVGGQVHVMGGLCSGPPSGGSGSASPRRPRVQSAAGLYNSASTVRNTSERHHATSGVLLEERDALTGLKQGHDDRHVHDGVLKCDGLGSQWVTLRSMRTPMHSMAAVAYQG